CAARCRHGRREGAGLTVARLVRPRRADYTPSHRSVSALMERQAIKIADIYVPVKRRATLKPDTVQELAQDMLEHGQKNPILVRRDGDRFVLVEGLHRLEGCK